MRGYSAVEVFDDFEQNIFNKAVTIVDALPEIADLRCHEVARVVGTILDIPVIDGKYGMVQHSWCLTCKPPSEGLFRADKRRPKILDVYAVGRLPIVQMLDTTFLLPHLSFFKAEGVRYDIRYEVIRSLIQTITESGLL